MTEVFSSRFKLKPPVNYVSDYERVMIAIQTDYLNGLSGKRWDQGQAWAFMTDVSEELHAAGFNIGEAKQNVYCLRIYSVEKDNKLNLYLHPQMITGDGKMDDITKIIEILKECPTVRDVYLHSHEPVYDMSDQAYHEFLLEHSDEIIKCMQDAVLCDKCMRKGAIGVDFAMECRIQRIGDRPGEFRRSDVDVQTVRDIYMTAEKDGLLDKEYILEQRSEEEEEFER